MLGQIKKSRTNAGLSFDYQAAAFFFLTYFFRTHPFSMSDFLTCKDFALKQILHNLPLIHPLEKYQNSFVAFLYSPQFLQGFSH